MKSQARDQFQMSLLQGLRVVQIGDGLAAAVCGRLLADLGAYVCYIGPDVSTPLAAFLDYGKSVTANDPAAARNAIAAADLIVCEGQPQRCRLARQMRMTGHPRPTEGRAAAQSYDPASPSCLRSHRRAGASGQAPQTALV